jgi:23S rRNA (cytosine1962-C5)-methyltransferase
MELTSAWEAYRVLDAGDGEKIERWGDVILRRPDPQVIWPWTGPEEIRRQVQAVYHRSRSGGGSWETRAPIPNRWTMPYRDLTFRVEPTGFKHTGLFPEQAVNWDWMAARIRAANRPVSVLNLFGYTGGATVACARAGAEVCHVDASKGMVNWARENLALSGLAEAPVRLIVDDCKKFVEREARRGRTYDAILMDPPSYGRGPGGELWKLEDELYGLIKSCMSVLSDSPLFFLVNAYTTGFSPQVPANLLRAHLGGSGVISAGEVGLPIGETSLVLPCGTFARWAEKP